MKKSYINPDCKVIALNNTKVICASPTKMAEGNAQTIEDDATKDFTGGGDGLAKDRGSVYGNLWE